ncbi:MAG: hypothetical protein GEU78_19685, partial [Actinobacteria bacterium]|nr:hypothetical protein [Actinomycetota bacterium]
NLGRLVCYVELVRAARVAAAERAQIVPPGIAYPHAASANAGKCHFASNYHSMVATVQDLVGGLIVTAPGLEDIRDDVYGNMVDKYLGGRRGVSGRDRWPLIQLVRDMTASSFGGYNDVVTLHGEGSPQTQLIAALRNYDLDRAIALVKSALAC